MKFTHATLPPANEAPRRVLLTDLLGDQAPAAVTWLELDGGFLAAYHPGRISFAEASSVLADMLGPITVTDAREQVAR